MPKGGARDHCTEKKDMVINLAPNLRWAITDAADRAKPTSEEPGAGDCNEDIVASGKRSEAAAALAAIIPLANGLRTGEVAL